MRREFLGLLGVVVGLGFAATACGSDDDGGTAPATGGAGGTGATGGTGASGGSAGAATGGTAGGGAGGTAGSGGTGGSTGTDKAFRVTKLEILDPHVHLNGGGTCAVDLNNTVNGLIKDAVEKDGDNPPDNLLDLSVVLNFKPLNQAGGGNVDLVQADCMVPFMSPTCVQQMGSMNVTTAYTSMATGNCFDPVASELTAMYNPKPMSVTGPCFTAGPTTVTLSVSGFDIPLQEGTIAAAYSGDPANALLNGVIRGFLSTTDAEAIVLPSDIPVVGGNKLSDLLCNRDKDTVNGTEGWTFYVGYAAAEAPFTP